MAARRAALALAGALALSSAGCYAIGYAYPTVDHIPEARSAAPADEVVAVRVDHRLASSHGMSGSFTSSECLFRRLEVGESVPTQVGVGLSRGYRVGIPMWGDGGHRGHTVSVRLYRRGFQTVELLPWEKPGEVNWVPAPTPFEREMAIKDLVYPSMRGWSWSMSTKPRPGSAGERHREVLLFAAAEYDRLAAECPDETGRERLRDEARSLRELAGV